MSEIIARVEWYPDKGVSAVRVLTDVVRINYTKGNNSNVNTCEITLVNPINQITSTGKVINKYVSNLGQLKFQEEDYIKVFIHQTQTTGTIDTSDTSPDLVFSGEVSEIEADIAKNKTHIKLKCVDKTFIMLNKLWSRNYNTTTMVGDPVRAPNIVKKLIRDTTGDGTSSIQYDANGVGISTMYGGGYDIDARLVSEGGFIEDTRPAKGAGILSPNFPTKTKSLVNKPVYDWLLQLSQVEMCNSQTEIDDGINPIKRSMIFYVDQLNRLHWFYPKDGVSSALSSDLTSGDDTGILVSDTSKFDSSGTVYINAEQIDYVGKDATTLGTTSVTRGVNNTIDATHASGANVTSSIGIIEGDSSNGFKLLSAKLTKKTYDIINMVIYNAGNDLNNNSISYYKFDSTTSFSKDKMVFKAWTDIAQVLKNNEAGYPASGPNITQNSDGTITINNTSGTTSWGESYTTSEEYNIEFIRYARERANDLSQKIIDQTGNIRWKGTITIRGRRLDPGVLIRYTSNSIGLQKQPLRVTQINNNIDKNGWTATLSVEEDKQEISLVV